MVDEAQPVDDGDDSGVVTLSFSRRSMGALASKWKHFLLLLGTMGSIGGVAVGPDAALEYVAGFIGPDPKQVECCVSVPGVLDRCKTVQKPPGAVATETPTCCDVVKHIALSCTEWRPDNEN